MPVISNVMPQEASRTDVAILFAIGGGFALVVLLFVVFGGPERTLGVALMALGAGAIFLARRFVRAKQALGIRLPMTWPNRGALRPLTVRLWGAGLILVGLLLVVGA